MRSMYMYVCIQGIIVTKSNAKKKILLRKTFLLTEIKKLVLKENIITNLKYIVLITKITEKDCNYTFSFC